MSSYQDVDPDKRQADRVLKLKEVMDITSLGSSTIYRHMEKGTFPKQVKIGGQRVGWMESDINKWLEKLKHTHVSV
ncbi:MAG: helix-turn-helix transcriptional regulator [Neptuniibacter sp.]